MKKFKFTLDALLDLRKRKEEQIKLELAKKNQQIFDARMQLFEMKNQLIEVQSFEKEDRSNKADIMKMHYSVTFRNKLKLDMLKAGQHIDKLESEFEGIRKKLIEASKKRKAIELIKEKRQNEWRKELIRVEQAFIDDISQQAYIRNQSK